MIKVRRTKNIFEEAEFLKQQRLDYHLLKVLVGEREGSRSERAAIDKLIKSRKDDIYVEALYVLTHNIIDDAGEAKDIYLQIIEHRDHLTGLLGRNVGIEVAALDYMRNILSLLDEPEIIEKSKINQFFKEAMLDEKTGAIGYGGLMVSLDAEIERANRYKRPFALLFIDIDDFKNINDTHGHTVGDHILRETVRIINERLRSLDKVFRYGGDELICLLPETDLRAASVVARRILRHIAAAAIDPPVKITVSIGITQADPQSHLDAQGLIKEADQAMYAAKKKGKNQIALAERSDRLK